MLNLLTALCLAEAGLILTLLGELLKWREERVDDKERRDTSRRMYRAHIRKVFDELYR